MIKEVIVVEGKNDTLRLQKFFDVETIETNGLGLNLNTLQFIKEVNDKKGVILLLDPDTPGEKIRQKINDYIPGLKNAFILKENARTTKKVGIEHSDKDSLQKALNNLITYQIKEESLSLQEFNELGLSGYPDSGKKRMIISKVFHIGKCNGKQMFKRLNMLGVNKKDIEDIL